MGKYMSELQLIELMERLTGGDDGRDQTNNGNTAD